MKEVYVVTYGYAYAYEPTYIAAVYSNKESAQSMVDFLKTDDNFDGYDYYNIEVFELDSKEVK